VVIVKKDIFKLLEGIHKSTTPNDWILSKTKDDATFPKIAAMISQYSFELEDNAKEQGVKAICVDKNFDTQLEEAKRYLIG
ncbi:MAG: hypothetical protein ACR2FM_00415, partial [Candidatus Saccharimonadales bacterium]